MNRIPNLRKAIAVATVLMVWAQPSCAPAPQVLPTQTVIIDTATPLATSTSTATSTQTETPLPTTTFTPAVTATQIPEVPLAAEGTANVIGLVLWNNLPVTKITVSLCKVFLLSGCGGQKYIAKTDENGYFVFKNVVPDQYLIVTNIINTNIYLFYLDANQSNLHTVSAGKDLILDPWNIWKLDLHITFPKNGDSTSNAHPTFKWDPYPDAAYYRIFLAEEKEGVMNSILENERVDGTEFTPEELLVTCKYVWLVQAFNAQDTIIAEVTPPVYEDAIYLPFFYITNLPETC